MVAAADQLAAVAGIGVLADGGSAADAAVATGTAMAVVGPHLCGLGGDVLAMVAAPGRSPEALLSAGRAGSGSDAARMRAEGLTTMPLRGDIRSVPVPGAVDGWLALHERYGRLPLERVLAPAIELAEDGFPASIMLAFATHLVHDVPGAGELCPDGPLEVGSTVRLPGIARTLRAIARDGRAGFYGAEFGRGLLELGAGHFSQEDLAASAARWCAPLGLRA
jgi:gamma-glutamyltranspeptidase/glutathione hydrolase